MKTTSSRLARTLLLLSATFAFVLAAPTCKSRSSTGTGTGVGVSAGITNVTNTTVPLSQVSSTLAAVDLNVTVSADAVGAAAQSRLDKIKDMYAFAGFVYALDNCPDLQQMTSDFEAMKSKGARVVITFDICNDGMDASYYEQAISAASDAGVYIIPLAWTLYDNGQSFSGTSVPRMQAVTSAVIKNPDPVLAIAYGDEPLYDNDAPSPAALASAIQQMKSQLASAGLDDIPVSISDMAYGWQSQTNDGQDIKPVVDVVDFFMINDFPFFAADATSGGAESSWESFTGDVDYFKSISGGKYLMVTQTGWSTSREEFAPNSPNIDISVASQAAYWHLLDSHCADYFKTNGIAWMWRSWDNDIVGWGVLDASGNPKFDIQAQTTC